MQARAGTIWLTGLSGSGKSTLAHALSAALRDRGADVALLDGEAIRAALPRAYGHGIEDRAEVLRHIVEICGRHARDGRPTIVATISHQVWMREHARRRLAPMLEVFLDCPAEVCASRDPKGHYARARAGRYECFVGVTHPYERSAAPDLTLDTARQDVGAALGRLLPVSLGFLGLAPA